MHVFVVLDDVSGARLCLKLRVVYPWHDGHFDALQDNPLQAAVVSQPGIPILGGLDMWEHSYYLKCASCTCIVMQDEMSSDHRLMRFCLPTGREPAADQLLRLPCVDGF